MNRIVIYWELLIEFSYNFYNIRIKDSKFNIFLSLSFILILLLFYFLDLELEFTIIL